MTKSIIFKILLGLGTVIFSIFTVSGYLFFQNDKALIAEIREYNLNSAMKALDSRLETSLKNNQEQMQDTTNMISKNSSLFLLNFDVDGLKDSLLFDMKRDGVQAIKVWDIAMNGLFLLAFKEDNKIVFGEKLPERFADFTKLKKYIQDNEHDQAQDLGELTLYYDESLIVNYINELKEQTKDEINSFNTALNNQLLQANITKLYIAIGFLITILAVSTILLVIFVNRPLKRLKTGLDDFFLFLQGKKESPQEIPLNSRDEFGQMARSLNKNISVSAALHAEISELNSDLEKKVAIRTQELSEINKEVQDSIEYASTIQRSFLTDSTTIKERIHESFVIWEPRDQVGGDLYIYEETSKGILFGVVDCTGHSVPGGFMTMLAGSLVKNLANDLFDNPAKILGELNIAIKQQLNQEGQHSLSDDGLDMGLCFIHRDETFLRFAGAKMDLVYIKDDEINIIKSNKQSIGYKRSKYDYEYTNHEIHLGKLESFYLYSDGITDQTGGEKGFPYGNKRFKRLLLSIQDQTMESQQRIIQETLTTYQGDDHRRDDVTVIGFKL
ncbi:MAG: SpoIIE family protein phosphatase [Desulfocapsa sp.]|nr:SpoIIE family protein phosphatase [Desulfocapsa sp.]